MYKYVSVQMHLIVTNCMQSLQFEIDVHLLAIHCMRDCLKTLEHIFKNKFINITCQFKRHR